MELLSTNFTMITEDIGKTMTGEEKYPIIGDRVTREEADIILAQFKGLNKHWQCLDKAEITQDIFGKWNRSCRIVIGEIRVMSGDFKSTYGHNFNPPYEFHAWLEVEEDIVDFALPGLIEKGLKTSDEFGPYLVNRKPIILAGKRPDWIYYKKIEYY